MKVIKKIRVSQGVKASLAFFIASLVTKGISFITTPIFTRLLSPDEFGAVSVYYTWAQLFGIISMFCLCYGVFNIGMLEHPEKRFEFAFSLLILSNIFTLGFVGILLCLYPLISNYINLSIPLLILMGITFLVQPAYTFWTVKQKFEYKYKTTIFWSIFCSLSSTAVAILFIVFNKNGSNVYPRIIGFEIPLILIYACFYVFIGIKSKFKLDISFWKQAILFNLPLIPHYLSSYLLNSSDKLMISQLVGDSETAFYSVAYAIASLVLIVWNAIDSSFVPYTYGKLKNEDYSSIKKISSILLLFFALGCFLVIMLAPEAIKIIGTEKYSNAAFVIPPIVGGVYFQVQYFLYSNVLYYYKKSKFVMFGSIISMLFNLGLNFIFIQIFGYIAAGYTTLFCFFLQALIDYIAMKRVIKKNIYDTKVLVSLSMLIIITSILSGFLYSFFFIRYFIVGLLFIVLIVFKRKIFEVFKIIREKDD